MYKKVVAKPEWLQGCDRVTDIFSVSGCMSGYFSDYIGHWRHNGFWLFDNPSIMQVIALKEGVNLRCMRCFYYEVHDEEFDQDTLAWSTISYDEASTNVVTPENKTLAGYDVVTFWARTSPECSPLSCNNVCKDVSVNEHCLIENFELAKDALERGVFKNSEPGPCRIFSLFTRWGLVLTSGSLRFDGVEPWAVSCCFSTP